MSEINKFCKILPCVEPDDANLRRKCWFLTLFDKTFTLDTAEDDLKRSFTTIKEYDYVEKVIAQMEQCPSTKNLHIHFAIMLDSKDRAPIRKFKELFPSLRSKGILAVEFDLMDLVYFYTAKAQSRVAGPLYYGWRNPETGKLRPAIPRTLYQDKYVPKPLSESTKEIITQKITQKENFKEISLKVKNKIRLNAKQQTKRTKELNKQLTELTSSQQIPRLAQQVAATKEAYEKASKDAWANNPCNKDVPLDKPITQDMIDFAEHKTQLANYKYVEAQIFLYNASFLRLRIETELKFWEEYTPSSDEPQPPEILPECPFILPHVSPAPSSFTQVTRYAPPRLKERSPKDQLWLEYMTAFSAPFADAVKVETDYKNKLKALESESKEPT